LVTAGKVIGLLLCFLPWVLVAQENVFPTNQNGTWDFSVWTAGATGEENTNSFAEARIWTAGVFIGRTITGEMGSGWRRGNLEYAFNLVPLFVTSKNQTVHGGGFEPVVLRWNSSLHTSRVLPYLELGGGAVATTANLPPGNTSSFNFTAKGGGGIHMFTKKWQSVDVGLHWWHVSNANLGVRNTEFNGIQLALGYHWFK
jgi:hypothetical protein